MKRLTLVAAMMAAVLGAVAGAQTTQWKGGSGVNTLQGCYQTADGVRCDFSYLPSEDRTSIQWDVSLFQVVNTGGANINATKIAVADGGWDTETPYLNIYSGVPVKVSVLFPLPKTTSNLRVLTIGGVRGDNIPVRGSAAPKPAPAAPVNVNLSNYNAALTGCKTTGTTITCTGAVLTPKR